MGNIFSYCFEYKSEDEENNTLLEKLTDSVNNTNLDYASFIDNSSMLYDNINLINQKIEILEKNTQQNFIVIQKDIKHIYKKQAEICNFINMNSSLSSFTSSKENISQNENENETENVDEMSIYLDTKNTIDTKSSDEETY